MHLRNLFKRAKRHFIWKIKAICSSASIPTLSGRLLVLMPPKKQTTNGITSPSSDAPEKKENKQKPVWTPFAPPPRKALHPPTMIMVKEALKDLDSQKGVSSQAIRNCIAKKYPTVDLVRLKYMVRKALIKGIESGMLVRPAKSKAAIGAQGRFLLATKKVKEQKGKTENVDPNAGKPTKGTKAAAKNSTESHDQGGASKKKDTVKEKPTRKVKADSGTSKVAPAKKPKAKKTVEDEESHPTKAKAKKTTAKGEDSHPAKSKARKTAEKEGGDEDSQPTKAKVKKTSEEDSQPTKAKVKKTSEEDSQPTKAKLEKTTKKEGAEKDPQPTKAKAKTLKTAKSVPKTKATKAEDAAKAPGKRGKKAE